MSLLQPLYNPVFKGTDSDGLPLPGGKIYTYAAGTVTPLATYADANGTTPKTNPIILDADGQALVYLGSQIYKFVLTDANDVVIWTADNISAVRVTDAASITGVLNLAQLPDYPLSRLVIDENPVAKFYYQQVQADGATLPQRPTLDFATGFLTFDDAPNNRTDVQLAASGVAAGSYTSANITVDDRGRVTSASNGSSFSFPPRVDDANGSSLTLPDGTKFKWGTSILNAPTGVPKGTISITFPGGPFTVVPSVTCSPNGNPGSSATLDPIECHPTDITVNGFNANFTADVLIGGSGAPNINNPLVHCCWEAKGY